MNPPDGTRLKTGWKVTNYVTPAPVYTYTCNDGRVLITADTELAIRVGCVEADPVPVAPGTGCKHGNDVRYACTKCQDEGRLASLERDLRQAKHQWAQWENQYNGLDRNSKRWLEEHKVEVSSMSARIAELELIRSALIDDAQARFATLEARIVELQAGMDEWKALAHKEKQNATDAKRDLEKALGAKSMAVAAERERAAHHAKNFDHHTAARHILEGLPYPLPPEPLSLLQEVGSRLTEGYSMGHGGDVWTFKHRDGRELKTKDLDFAVKAGCITDVPKRQEPACDHANSKCVGHSLGSSRYSEHG